MFFCNKYSLNTVFCNRITSLFVPTSTWSPRIRIVRCVHQVLSSTLVFIVARRVPSPPFSLPIYDRFNPRTSSFSFFPGCRWRSIDHRRSAVRYRFFANGIVGYLSIPERYNVRGRLAGITFRAKSSKVSPDTKCRCAGNVQISMYVHRRRIPALRQVARTHNDASSVLSPTGFFTVYVSSNGCLRGGLHRFRQ